MACVSDFNLSKRYYQKAKIFFGTKKKIGEKFCFVKNKFFFSEISWKIFMDFYFKVL